MFLQNILQKRIKSLDEEEKYLQFGQQNNN
jgi:hypothetical protein